jgi:UDP-N-acetylmuramoyl-L-alanyl-D-glutamate--2,6-diaminopimelate ligase
MMAMRTHDRQWGLGELLEGFAQVGPGQDRLILNLTLDSRSVRPGSLFLACAGSVQHGLAFASQAVEQGAVAMLCEPTDEWTQARVDGLAQRLMVPIIPVPRLGLQAGLLASRFFGEPSHALCVVGVTGTNGKTSCSQFLAQALGEDAACGIIGTLGNGFPGALVPGRHTTPGPVELQATLAELRQRGAQAVAMEVSSHALDQGRAVGVHIDTAVLTNLSRDHLDFHGTMVAYAASKQRLFQQPGLRCAVLNLDDPFGWQVLSALPQGVKVLAYGLSRPQRPLPESVAGWLWATEIIAGHEGAEIQLQSSWGEASFTSPLLGRFNVSNLLAVLAVLLERGIAMDDAVRRLASLQGVPGRMERFGAAGQPLVVVDYAHTPDALEQAILALRPHAPGRLICLFGCGGERDKGKRPLMGGIAGRLCDRVILTDDNPRGEEGGRIVADILAGIERPELVQVERNRASAIRQAIQGAGPDDLVLVSGKGHEAYQQYGELRLPFSDQEQVQILLGKEAAP